MTWSDGQQEREGLHAQAAAAFAEAHGLVRTKRRMSARLNELRDAEEEFERRDDPGVYWRQTPDGIEYGRLYREHSDLADALSDLMLASSAVPRPILVRTEVPVVTSGSRDSERQERR